MARLADVGFALGAAGTGCPPDASGQAAIGAVAALAYRVGMTHALADFGITADYRQTATDALGDEVLANTPRAPDRADVLAVLAGRPGMPAMPR
ncbi:MAG: iron-containing alcohol dehydrogenase [Streptosporangiaceae bacterium]